MTLVSRSSILSGLVVVILLATLPGAIRRLVQTGDLYLFSQQCFQDMLARLSGPGRLRFFIQPSIAILLGSRDGLEDAASFSLGPHVPRRASAGAIAQYIRKRARPRCRRDSSGYSFAISDLLRNSSRRGGAPRSGADRRAICRFPRVLQPCL